MLTFLLNPNTVHLALRYSSSLVHITVYFKDSNFFLFYSNTLLSANCSIFNVSFLSSTLAFPASITPILCPFHWFNFTLFVPFIYTFMCCIVHTYKILTHALPVIYSIYPIISIHIDILQYPIHYIISYCISQNIFVPYQVSIDSLLVRFTICHILNTNTASYIPFYFLVLPKLNLYSRPLFNWFDINCNSCFHPYLPFILIIYSYSSY